MPPQLQKPKKGYFLIQPRIPADVYQGLREVAANQGLPIAAFVRQLVYLAVKAHRREQKATHA